MFLMQISTFLSRDEGNLKVAERSYTIPFGTEENSIRHRAVLQITDHKSQITDQIQTDSPNQRS
jgi:hypothetical protein